MYRRFGFVPAGVRRKYYENTDDAIIMWAHGVDSDEFIERTITDLLRAVDDTAGMA